MAIIISPFYSLVVPTKSSSDDISVRSGNGRYLERQTGGFSSQGRQSAITYHGPIPQSADRVSEGAVEEIWPIETISPLPATVEGGPEMESSYMASAQKSCLAALSISEIRPSSTQAIPAWSLQAPLFDNVPSAVLPSLGPDELTIRSPVFGCSVTSHDHTHSKYRIKRPQVPRPRCKFNCC